VQTFFEKQEKDRCFEAHHFNPTQTMPPRQGRPLASLDWNQQVASLGASDQVLMKVLLDQLRLKGAGANEANGDDAYDLDDDDDDVDENEDDDDDDDPANWRGEPRSSFSRKRSRQGKAARDAREEAVHVGTAKCLRRENDVRSRLKTKVAETGRSRGRKRTSGSTSGTNMSSLTSSSTSGTCPD